MSAVALPVLASLLAAALLGALPPGWGARANLGASALTFALALALAFGPLGAAHEAGGWWLADPLGVHLAVLTAFVGLTTAWYSLGYVAAEQGPGRLEGVRLRLYHAGFQAVTGFVLLALLSDNPGAAWVGLEGATIAAALVVGLPGTREAVEAAWRFLLICGVGLALALFGTLVLTLAAQPVLGAGSAAMSWSGLARAAPRLDGDALNLAFALLLVGYGTKAALVPLHAWMPDAHAAGPTPVAAILSGGILNAALAALLRLRGVMEANAEAVAPGPPLMALGLASALVGAFALWRQRDVTRFFAVSTVEQGGVVAFAFGLGGSAATFAGLLHLTAHTLAKAAVFQCVGRAAQLAGGQRDGLGGLLASHPALGLPLALGIVAVAGLPPFGLFASEFLIVAETVRRAPWLAVPLGLALVVGAWALVARLQGVCLGPAMPVAGPAPGRRALAGAWLHLAAVLALGVALPAPLAAWMRGIAAGLP